MAYSYGEMAAMRQVSARFAERARERRQALVEGLEASRAAFVEDLLRGEEESELYAAIREEFAAGALPSAVLEQRLAWLFRGLVFPCRKACALYAADASVRWAYAGEHPGRRSFHSADTAVHVEAVMAQLAFFVRLDYVEKDFLAILRGELSEEERAYVAGHGAGVPSFALAYEIDRGNEAVIAELEAILRGESAVDIDRDIILGVLQGSHAGLHVLLGKLLLAARLQEGLRQAICEQADMGTVDGFLEVVRVIHEHGLIRFSSVKRALGVWTGLIADASDKLERLSQKTEQVIWAALTDASAREAFLQSEDSMHIYLALWAMGVREAREAVSRITELADSGTPHQVLSACYAAAQFCNERLAHEVAAAMLERRSEQDILAVCMPSFMPHAWYDIYRATHLPRHVRERGHRRRPRCRLEDYFADREEAERYEALLMRLYEGIKGKAVSFAPCIFPWHKAELSKEDIAGRLCWIASALGDEERIDRALDYLDDVAYLRARLIALLLPFPRTEKQMRVLTERVCDRQEDTREQAFALIRKLELDEGHYRLLEDMLRYKNADMRAKLIVLLLRQKDDALHASLTRLLTDKKEEKRTAGLDMVLQLTGDEARRPLYERCRRLVAEGHFPTTKEQILAAQIVPTAEEAEAEPAALYDEGDGYVPRPDAAFLARAEAVFRRYFYHQGVIDRLRGRKQDFELVLDKLLAFMEEHGKAEFTNFLGETLVLATGRLDLRRADTGGYTLSLSELWDAFYEQHVASPVLLLRAFTAAVAEGDYDEFARLCTPFVKRHLGEEFTRARALPQPENVADIFKYLLAKHGDGEELLLIAAHLAHALAQEENIGLSFHYPYYHNTTRHGTDSVLSQQQFKLLLSPLDEQSRAGGDTEQFFPICHALESCPGCRKRENSRIPQAFLHLGGYGRLRAEDYLRAAHRGIISGRFLFRALMEPLDGMGEDRLDALYFLSRVARGGSEAEGLAREEGLPEFALSVYERLMAAVLHEELRRGDTPTRFSRYIFRIGRVCGVRTYVQLLAALGREPLSRGKAELWRTDGTKRECLSHLLAVCVPREGEDAGALAACLAGTDVSEERLIEAAMYSPDWMDITEAHLGWSGFKSGCYYFMAHTGESIDARREAFIATCTPLSIEELNNGAFDAEWFRCVHTALGDKRFELLYKAAKYSCNNAKHTRARKYADAASGRLDAEETRRALAGKRDKDLLMAYALIPLADEADLLARYLCIRQFLRESRQFGAQRQASERLAAESALRNLAMNAGFADVARLTLRMETQLTESTRSLLEEVSLGDVSAQLVLDAQGKADILCRKGGKALRTVPAKLKKDAHILLLQETKKSLNEQHARTRQMLEHAMEDGTAYPFAELATLLDNPVVKPLLSALVFLCGQESGYLSPEGLLGLDAHLRPLGAGAEMRVAHPFELYAAGSWVDWQRELFARGIVQPFRQVFRELYVKTPEERGMMYSRRYAGHQVQPQKALACLKSRRWVADIENGLQKVCYSRNVVAHLYARADWFSPSDIEAPALEWVEFTERLSGKPLALSDVPDVLFSEVMRDVDLAVSVAHAGGVDPETSHSTIEMRAALLRFTLPLFKLGNVEIHGSHAHISGSRADYTLHLGSGIVHRKGGTMLNILPVHSQQRGRLFLPFADDDPRTAEIISKALLLAEDAHINDPAILAQLRR